MAPDADGGWLLMEAELDRAGLLSGLRARRQGLAFAEAVRVLLEPSLQP